MTLPSTQRCPADAAARLVAVAGRGDVASLRRAIVGAVAGGEHLEWTSPPNHAGGLSWALFSLAPLQDFGAYELPAERTSQTAPHGPCRPQIFVAGAGEAANGPHARSDELQSMYRELLAQTAEGGWAVLPGDDLPWRRAAQGYRGKVLWYGRGGDCDIAAAGVAFGDGLLRFTVGGQAFRVPAWGRSGLEELLAAVAVGHLLGVPLAGLAEGMAQRTSECGTHRLVHMGKATLIHDEGAIGTAALCRALEMLREFPSAGRRIVCLGDMVEDGSQGPTRFHRVANQLVTRCGADVLIACGSGAQQLATSAHAAGMPAEKAIVCEHSEHAIDVLRRELHDRAVVLVAGEPREQMTHLVESLRQQLFTSSPELVSK